MKIYKVFLMSHSLMQGFCVRGSRQDNKKTHVSRVPL